MIDMYRLKEKYLRNSKSLFSEDTDNMFIYLYYYEKIFN